MTSTNDTNNVKIVVFMLTIFLLAFINMTYIRTPGNNNQFEPHQSNQTDKYGDQNQSNKTSYPNHHMLRSIKPNLFAGSGLMTYTRGIFHKGYVNVNCTTYDDCHNLLCDYLGLPILRILVKPISFAGDCNKLNITDTKLMSSEYDVYVNSKYNATYDTTTVSEASVLLCDLGKDVNVTEIVYYIYSC